MEHLLEQLIGQGAIGVIAAIALYVAWKKDQTCTALHERLELKAEKMTEKYYTLTSELNATLDALTEALQVEEVEDET